MKVCTSCILNDSYPDINFNNKGECSLCSSGKTFSPIGEDALIKIFESAKKKNRQYDALVPLSGGKDSTYILHLAVNVYKLNVISMTYDNGLLSKTAINNINESIKKTNVKHVYYSPDKELQNKVLKYMLLYSGDMCGACDIGTKAAIIKVAKQYKVPTILYGTSPLEEDSFLPDNIQDIARFKYILNKTKKFTKNEINSFLIFPNLNLFKLSAWKKLGVIGKEVRPLFFIDNPSDAEMGEIIKKELNWNDNNDKEYSKHFDCIAEPFTNYIRHKIYGYERRICQYSNMVRRNEIDREKAMQLYNNDHINNKPDNYRDVLNTLNLREDDLDKILRNYPLKYKNRTSKIDEIFRFLMKLLKE
jgi:hypothetical protein